jgi:type IV secretory pathway TraG/TraD family ATPase VirD4
MIHDMITAISTNLPLPHILPGAITGLLIAVSTFLWLKRGSRSGVIMLLALAIGLGALTWGVLEGQKLAPLDWGNLESLGETLVGPFEYRFREQIVGAVLVAAAMLFYVSWSRTGGEVAIGAQVARKLQKGQDILGNAQLVDPQVFKKRWIKPDPLGLTLKGRFWGQGGKFLGTQFCLDGEDVARGIAAFGTQGSGKTQAVILPAIADRMKANHSLVVTDVQGELTPYILAVAGITNHLVIVHNPSAPAESARFNVAEDIQTVIDAKAIAAVLLSSAKEDFWSNAGQNLLAGCLLHYPSIGAMMEARRDAKAMARELKDSRKPGVPDLTSDFYTSILSNEPKLAMNIMATVFNQALAAWADEEVCRVTATSQFDAATLEVQPTVLILRSSRRHQDALGKYLGAVLRVFVTTLDDFGEQQPGGMLPIPVGLILEEFPSLGRLDSLVRDINLVRKRRISVLTAAQTLAQFEGIYGRQGSEQLLAGLATKIVFGGCDQYTAEFFSRLSGQTTIATASLSEHSGRTASEKVSASLRGRALLLPDEIIRPAKGQATIFAATPGVQEMFHADLTMFWQRKDWQRKLKKAEPKTPLEPLDPLPVRGKAESSPRPRKEPETQIGGRQGDMNIDELPGWPDWDDL